MAEQQDERRQYRRVNAEVHVSVQKHDTEMRDISTEEGKSRNLSAGGILLHHENPLEVPSYIIVSFSLPDSSEKLDFIGKVVRIEEIPQGGYEIGIMFMKMILGEFNAIQKFISEKTSG